MMLFSFITNTILSTGAQIEGIIKYKQQDQWVKTDHCISKSSSEQVALKETDPPGSSKRSIAPKPAEGA